MSEFVVVNLSLRACEVLKVPVLEELKRPGDRALVPVKTLILVDVNQQSFRYESISDTIERLGSWGWRFRS